MPTPSRADRLTPDIHATIKALEQFLNSRDDESRRIGSARCGVYAFYDYDDEPIYVGQTYESLSTRIRRHLTGQRSDAVAKHVLDPLEVARVEIWPFWGLESTTPSERSDVLDRAESTVFQLLSGRALVSKLLNEYTPPNLAPIALPPSHAGYIVPAEVRSRTQHRDERIARRAATIANLAQVVKERDVSIGLRRTLLTQAERLQLLASQRLQELVAATPAEEIESETEREGV